RLYIGIIKDDSGNIELWATEEDGSKISTRFTGNKNKSPTMAEMYNGWAAQKKTITIDLQGKELSDYIHYLTKELHAPVTIGHTQKRRVQSIAYFSQGFIGIASPEPQPEETINLLERFAGVFNLTFARFNDLKIAEAHALQAELDLEQLQSEKRRAEDALTELRATQKQLIQSEKMASLGELTAGIAHEIQNPLNFVNNFSEVNAELIDELKTELATGNTQQAIELANDIKDNEQKINHHGKRAEAIVKGMLQHSRSSSGVKELTDINASVDEYLRLAYHGLRAKDKSFNATMKTDYDDNIGLINIIPQDIGRVILNLITNAFYAVSTAPKSPVLRQANTQPDATDSTPSSFHSTSSPQAAQHPGDFNFELTVTVITKLLKSPIWDSGVKGGPGIEIRVSDNGNGIPQNILDKIFQPFFTTKPTGKGTGLGLSLSYDIIKAHGGELKVETREGEWTQFIIQLPVTVNN
ncbi:MAG: ATP-binding protein, partial [Saprospiraceae bacterium]